MTDLIDMSLGQYHLTEVIGSGGMSVVYKAYQPMLDRFVAVKVLLHNNDPQFAVRFKREARAIAHLQHPNILPIYDYNEQDGLYYLVLQYIENGTTLSDLLGTPMAPIAALRLTTHLLAALDYAHTRGVIHRDIKPSNILMLSPRWPVLADFGIAKLLTDNQHLTMSGVIMGTAAYMAPEQAIGRTIDTRTDLYSAGIVLYELLTGRVPFDADTPIALLMKQAYEAPLPPRRLNPDIPVSVETALLRALAKEPDSRYQSAAVMAEELERVATQLDRGSTHDQLTSLYQAGAQAFRAGHWDTAIEQLSRLVALDATYEDAQLLLNQARTGRDSSQREAARRAAGSGLQLEHEQLPSQVALARCPRCGKEVQSEWTGCPYCLAPLGATATKPSSEAASALRRIGWRLWAALLIVLVLLGSGVVLARGRGGSVPTPIPTTIATAPAVVIAGKTPSDTLVPTNTTAPTAIATPTTSATPTPMPTDTPMPPSAPTPDAVVNISQLNLRSGPDTRFPSLGLYTQDTTLQVVGKEPAGQWLQVQTPDNRTGWMLATNLRLNIPLADVPVVAAPPLPTSPPTPKLRPTPRPQPTAAPVQPTEAPAPPTEAPVQPTAVPPTPLPPTAIPTNKPDPGPRPTRKPPQPTPRP